MKEQITIMWEKYNNFKQTAEQHQFPTIFMYDMILEPKYKDLQENWTDEHAEIFIKGLDIVFKKLGIE